MTLARGRFSIEEFSSLTAYPSFRAVLGSRSLRSLVLPGTHNSGSYSLADDNDVVAAWVVCQDEDIISQLLYGNRLVNISAFFYYYEVYLLNLLGKIFNEQC